MAMLTDRLKPVKLALHQCFAVIVIRLLLFMRKTGLHRMVDAAEQSHGC